jgi:hypothetical protein
MNVLFIIECVRWPGAFWQVCAPEPVKELDVADLRPETAGEMQFKK